MTVIMPILMISMVLPVVISLPITTRKRMRMIVRHQSLLSHNSTTLHFKMTKRKRRTALVILPQHPPTAVLTMAMAMASNYTSPPFKIWDLCQHQCKRKWMPIGMGKKIIQRIVG
jgi:hypothetical protein